MTPREQDRYKYQLEFVRDFLRRENITTQSAREAEREAVAWLFNELQRRFGNAR